MTQRNLSAPKSAQVTHPTRRLIAAGIIRRTPANAAAAQQHRLAQLHRACQRDYADATPARTGQTHRTPSLYGTAAVTR
ncbi:hypothetical protein ACFWN1_05735 [Streptomyces sp. NPDC058459]|uniref:hypothetical protein n=1 Tax=Streptomyces sp. NPDC058459 TaxID=3346508 RepID=UPI0036552F9B